MVIDKPPGFHVHAPEDARLKISDARNCLKILRQQTGLYLYPVHRIDAATSGVLVYALSSEAAAHFNGQFRGHTMAKIYFCVVRGWLQGDGIVDRPLKNPDTGEPMEARTRFHQIARVELPIASAGHATSRYGLVRAEPLTGRLHQIRRHFQGMSHPLVGDVQHGDAVHNRIFRELLGTSLLLLKAYSLTFTSPATNQQVYVHASWNNPWHKTFDLFGLCPCEPSPLPLHPQRQQREHPEEDAEPHSPGE